MNKIISLPLFLLLCFVLPKLSYAQDLKKSITITGSSAYNLSPNEIIIRLSIQEYFKSEAEIAANKVRLKVIEKDLLTALSDGGVAEDKITQGEIAIIQPNRNNNFKKRRLNKSFYICVSNTEEFVRLVDHLEADKLLEKCITYFSIVEYRHTKKQEYLQQSRAAAFEDAKAKAELILSTSTQKVGQAISIKEINRNTAANGSFYGVDNGGSAASSGFKPVVVSYNLEVTFEIL